MVTSLCALSDGALVATANGGDLMQLETEMEVVGTVEAGLEDVRVSPDQEMMILVTKEQKLGKEKSKILTFHPLKICN